MNGTWSRARRALLLAAAAAALSGRAAAATGADGADPLSLPVIVVYAPTPLHGLGLDPDKMPNTTRVMSGRDLTRSGEASLTGALDSQVGGVNLTNTFGNPNQPDLRYRGFTASPVEGTPQGLAVYQDGVRLNEAFGDTVNWDLVPDFAIQSLNLTSMNPVFGFNALGGAASLEMKDGFTYHGGEAQASAGSFRRVAGSAQYGRSAGAWGGYLGMGGSSDSGWREGQPSRLQKLYGDFGYDDRAGRSAHLSVTYGQDHLAGTGPSPVQLLALDRAAGATSPDYTENSAVMVSLRGTTPTGDNDSLQGGFYFRHFAQRVSNGNPTSASVCGAFYCSGSAQLLDPAGNPVPTAVGGQFPAELDLGRTNTNGVGGVLQGSWRDDLGGHANQLTSGASLDYGFTGFESATRFGSFDDSRVANAYLPVTSSGTIHDVSAVSQNSYGGFYFTDTFDLTPALSLTASGRYNAAVLHLDDRLGGDLNGVHHYYRFNPAGGAAWKFAPWATAYADYAENNRVPTAAELSCADPTQSCSLASFFVADPDLHQVVARTYETGLRGTFDAGAARAQWDADLFRTDDTNDILQVSAPALDRGYFVNAGKTRRQGIEASLSLDARRWRVALDYGLVDATFQSPLTLSSSNNPAADGNGLIQVGPGDRLPGVPRHRVKVSLDGSLTAAWTAGVALNAQSGQYLQGDESNQTAALAGFWTLALHSEYALTPAVSLFGRIDNLLDRRYDVYGTFTSQAGVPYPGIPGGITDPRSVTPAPPFAAFLGLRVKI